MTRVADAFPLLFSVCVCVLPVLQREAKSACFDARASSVVAHAIRYNNSCNKNVYYKHLYKLYTKSIITIYRDIINYYSMYVRLRRSGVWTRARPPTERRPYNISVSVYIIIIIIVLCKTRPAYDTIVRYTEQTIILNIV